MTWFSPYWFYLDTLKSFFWANGHLLWLLALIPIFFFLKWVFQGPNQQVLSLSLKSVSRNRSILVNLRFLVPLFFVFGLGSLILAIARPQLSVKGGQSISEGVDIAIAVDISDSMMDTDFSPNRLEAAKQIATKFIEGRTNDRISLVAFAGETLTLSPLTTDYSTLKDYLSMLEPSLIRTSGTAIGMALASCVNKLRDVTGKSKVAIIMSDGDNTAGAISPETALDLSKTFDVRVYTIAIGKPSAVEKVDEKTLKMLASGKGGRFFRATDNDALDAIFQQINDLEKSRENNEQSVEMVDHYYQYLYWTLFFFLLTFFLKVTLLGNLMED